LDSDFNQQLIKQNGWLYGHKSALEQTLILAKVSEIRLCEAKY